MLHEYQPTSTDLLDDVPVLERASTGKRLANYLIDVVVFYVLTFVFAFALISSSPSSADYFDDDSTGLDLGSRIMALVIYALYMSIIEALLKGKSLGKLITKTRAVNLDGSPINAKTAFARGFSRAVPFCVFSVFGKPCNPWQDRWTDTMVIDERSQAG